ncbi:hypothetical protein C8A05DRAFT_32016 [Staphylotrichum tortipilum]|uniref:Uncharacterized protein n=1 Tax=Staphylotrichum tortipilum TaxID=2831512 RepID=A0AAN6MQP1_9PEZI|nr:hypothetical protein C8A05DRAFT_32016 [Staphylotrichum longicolle]
MTEAHDAQRREVQVWEAADDLLALYRNNFNFQFAKSVSGKNGEVTYNIIWQSKNLAPRFNIAWEPIYALNWRPQRDARRGLADVRAGPDTPSTVPPKANFMNIGKNGYRYEGQNGIHIVIGVKNSAGGYDVIYVDSTELGLNMGSWYQPQETVKWWYQTGVRTATMIAGADTPVHTFDMSAPNPETGLFYISTTYIYATGQWINSPNAPATALETGVLGFPRRSGPVLDGGSGGNTGTGTGSGGSNQALHDKMTAIEKTLLQIATLLSTDGAHLQLAPYQGTIIWPGLTNPAVMDAGGTIAANFLSNIGYMANFTHDMNTMHRRAAAAGVPMGVQVAWDNAFNAIPAGGQQDGGVIDVGTAAVAGVGTRALVAGGDGGEKNGEKKQQNGDGAEGKKGETVLQIRKAHARAIVAGAS